MSPRRADVVPRHAPRPPSSSIAARSSTSTCPIRPAVCRPALQRGSRGRLRRRGRRAARAKRRARRSRWAAPSRSPPRSVPRHVGPGAQGGWPGARGRARVRLRARARSARALAGGAPTVLWVYDIVIASIGSACSSTSSAGAGPTRWSPGSSSTSGRPRWERCAPGSLARSAIRRSLSATAPEPAPSSTTRTAGRAAGARLRQGRDADRRPWRALAVLVHDDALLADPGLVDRSRRRRASPWRTRGCRRKRGRAPPSSRRPVAASSRPPTRSAAGSSRSFASARSVASTRGGTPGGRSGDVCETDGRRSGPRARARRGTPRAARVRARRPSCGAHGGRADAGARLLAERLGAVGRVRVAREDCPPRSRRRSISSAPRRSRTRRSTPRLTRPGTCARAGRGLSSTSTDDGLGGADPAPDPASAASPTASRRSAVGSRWRADPEPAPASWPSCRSIANGSGSADWSAERRPSHCRSRART